MNTNSSKCQQVVPAKQHHHNTDIQNTKSDTVVDYFSLCKENAQKWCEDKSLHSLNYSTDSGNNFINWKILLICACI